MKKPDDSGKKRDWSVRTGALAEVPSHGFRVVVDAGFFGDNWQQLIDEGGTGSALLLSLDKGHLWYYTDIIEKGVMARSEKLKKVRWGQRCIALSAILRGGGGTHKNRQDKRRSNSKNDWRRDWD